MGKVWSAKNNMFKVCFNILNFHVSSMGKYNVYDFYETLGQDYLDLNETKFIIPDQQFSRSAFYASSDCKQAC